MRAWFAFIALSDHVSSGFGRFGMLTVLSLRPLSSQVKRIDLNGYQLLLEGVYVSFCSHGDSISLFGRHVT